MAFTKSWDETTPVGTDVISDGDDKIRDLKFGLRERLAVDHDHRDVESGSEDTITPTGTIGYHKKATFTERSTDPTAVTDAAILYSKDVSGVTELFMRNSTLIRQIPSMKMGTFTHTTSGTGGSASQTGVGFKPRIVFFMANNSFTDAALSFGIDNGTNAYCVFNYHNVTSGAWQNAAISIYQIYSSTANIQAYITSLDSDGFTMSWTMAGAPPTGNVEVFYLALG